MVVATWCSTSGRFFRGQIYVAGKPPVNFPRTLPKISCALSCHATPDVHFRDKKVACNNPIVPLNPRDLLSVPSPQTAETFVLDSRHIKFMSSEAKTITLGAKLLSALVV